MIEKIKIEERRKEFAEGLHAGSVYRDIQAREKERKEFEKRWFWELLQNAKDSVLESEKVNLGIVQNYFSKLKVAQIFLNHRGVKIGDEIIIEGKTTFLKQKISSIQINKRNCNKSKKGDIITIEVDEKVRKNDLVFLIKTIKNE